MCVCVCVCVCVSSNWSFYLSLLEMQSLRSACECVSDQCVCVRELTFASVFACAYACNLW